jgi:single-strand DNA-binding protein
MVNKAILVGRVGKDPEVQTSTSGKTVAKFSLATTEKYKDKETTEWHNIVLWNKLAEIAGKYVNKGSLLYIEGKITTPELSRAAKRRRLE